MPLIEPLKFRKSGSTVVAPAEMEPGDQIPGAYVSDIAVSNLLINGDMRINQRAFAGSALAAAAFGYDRWFADTGGASVSVSAAGVITHASGTICQAIEAPRGVFGAAITISVGDLSGGNLTVNVGGNIGTITPGAGRQYVTVNAPGGSGSGNLLVKLTPATASVTYREIGFVRGTDMAGFEYRLLPFEMANCQRYYENSFMPGVAPASGATLAPQYSATLYTNSNARAYVPFKATKRGVGVVAIFASSVVSGGANGQWQYVNTSVNFANANTLGNNVNVGGFTAEITLPSAQSYGQSLVVAGHWACDAEIQS